MKCPLCSRELITTKQYGWSPPYQFRCYCGTAQLQYRYEENILGIHQLRYLYDKEGHGVAYITRNFSMRKPESCKIIMLADCHRTITYITPIQIEDTEACWEVIRMIGWLG